MHAYQIKTIIIYSIILGIPVENARINVEFGYIIN